MNLSESKVRILLSAVFLFSAETTWAAEPPHPANPAASGQYSSPEGWTSAPQPAPPTAPAADGQSGPDSPPPRNAAAAPNPPPNAVEASPYGAATNETPTVALPPTTLPPPKPNDAPATLFDSGADYAIGGFGGFGVMYTRFSGSDRPLVCGEGAVIIDHKFTFGGGGCGIAALMEASDYGGNIELGEGRRRMTFGYGGAIARYHFFSRQIVNLAVGALVGAGGLEIGTWNGNGNKNDFSQYDRKSQDAVFVVEPQVGGYANLTRWLRVGLVGGFRFVAGVDTKGLSNSDFMGPTLGGQIQAGWF